MGRQGWWHRAAVRLHLDDDWVSARWEFDVAVMHAVKLAWRNRAMHVDATFSLDNARDIFNAMKALMQYLATQLPKSSAAA